MYCCYINSLLSTFNYLFLNTSTDEFFSITTYYQQFQEPYFILHLSILLWNEICANNSEISTLAFILTSPKLFAGWKKLNYKIYQWNNVIWDCKIYFLEKKTLLKRKWQKKEKVISVYGFTKSIPISENHV